MHTEIETFCCQCGKKFLASKMTLRWNGSIPCSEECATEFNKRIQWTKEEEKEKTGVIPE